MRYLLFSLLFIFTIGTYAQNMEHEKRYRAALKTANQGNHEEAIKEFSSILAEDPEHFNSYLQRGFSNSMLENYEEAIVDFSTAIEMRPNHSWAYKNRGASYSKLGKYELAIDDFTKMLEFEPESEEALLNRGFAKKAKGDKEGACEDWYQAKKNGSARAKLVIKNNSCK